MKPNLLKHIDCPICKKQIPEFEGEVSWCSSCDWNLMSTDLPELNVFEKYHAKIGKKISQSLFESLMNKRSLKPEWGFTKLSTLALCLAVISLPLFMIWTSYLAYLYLPIMIFLIIALVCVGVAYISLTVKISRPQNIISLSEAPELHKLVDRISEKIKSTKIAKLSLNHEFNAYYSEYGIGLFKKRYVTIGVPLAEVLSAEELIALLSHEISHGANGDVARGIYMYRAQTILAELYRTFAPRHAGEGSFDGDGFKIFVVIGNYLGYFTALFPLVIFKLVTALSMRDSQEAEYYADLLASNVCGRDAMITMLKKLRYIDSFSLAGSRASESQGKINFYKELQRLCAIEKSENANLRYNRLEEHQGLSLDCTHPPLAYRIKFIETKAEKQGTLNITTEEFQKIKAELAKFHDKTAKRIIDDHLYYLT